MSHNEEVQHDSNNGIVPQLKSLIKESREGSSQAAVFCFTSSLSLVYLCFVGVLILLKILDGGRSYAGLWLLATFQIGTALHLLLLLPLNLIFAGKYSFPLKMLPLYVWIISFLAFLIAIGLLLG